MSQVNHRVEMLIEEMNRFDSWEEKYAHIIKCGKFLGDFPIHHRNEDNLVKGCQSQVWIFAKMDEHDKVQYFADSDAAIVRGIVSILLRIYSNLPPNEILELSDAFIDLIGLRQHLSMSRANGLSAMLRQMKLYALAFQTQLEIRDKTAKAQQEKDKAKSKKK